MDSPEGSDRPEARESGDRRSEPSVGRRTGEGADALKRKRRNRRIIRDVLIGVASLAAIGFTASVMHPAYGHRAPVVREVVRAVEPPPRAAVEITIPEGTLEDSIRAIEASGEYKEQQRRFASDLVRTGRMSQARADSVAHFA